MTGPGVPARRPVAPASRRARRRSVARSSRPRVQAMTGCRTSGPWPRSATRAASCARVGAGRRAGRAARPVPSARSDRAVAAAVPDDGGVVVERRPGGRRPSRSVSAVTPAPPIAAARTAGDGSRETARDARRPARGSPSRRIAPRPATRSGVARAAQQVVDDRGRAWVRAVRAEQARDGARTAGLGSTTSSSTSGGVSSVASGRRTGAERPDRRRSHALVGVEQAGLGRGDRGRRATQRPSASSAAARTVGSASSSTVRMSAGPARSTESGRAGRRPSRGRPARAPRARRSRAARHGRVAGQGAAGPGRPRGPARRGRPAGCRATLAA